jgi:hypothetical protein
MPELRSEPDWAFREGRPRLGSRVFQGGTGAVPPGLGCDVLNCVDLEFRGGGIVDYGVSESFDAAGWFTVGGQTFTFAAVPEPATLSLFAVGLVGLAIWRKQSPHSTRHSRLRL